MWKFGSIRPRVNEAANPFDDISMIPNFQLPVALCTMATCCHEFRIQLIISELWKLGDLSDMVGRRG
jgi:hypothetical protein